MPMKPMKKMKKMKKRKKISGSRRRKPAAKRKSPGRK
jgi:hypothetical protein